MDLLPELYNVLLYYLSVDDLIEFRVTAKESCEQVKRYEGSSTDLVFPNSLPWCLHCFPNLKYLDVSNCELRQEDFHALANVQELSMQTRQLLAEDVFQPCSKLTSLILTTDYSRIGQTSKRIKHNLEVDLAFQHLTQLKQLTLCNMRSVTEHALLYLTQLVELNLYDNSRITSVRCLPRLKRLSIQTPLNEIASPICDEALEGLPLQQLNLLNQHWITDQGILHLTQLKRLFCVKTRIQGIGFTSLKQLVTVGIGDATIHDLSGFVHVRTLTFHDCKIRCKFEGTWKLQKLRFYSCSVKDPMSIKTIVAPQLKQLKYDGCNRNICNTQKEYMLQEASLRETFGSKLVFKN